MARLTVYRDNQVSSTAVSNLFIDEYMKNANDAQLKVYLYLLRMMNANQATSVPDIADKFNHTEKEVIRALKYWEKLGLLDLDYDESRSLVTNIFIRELCPQSAEGAEGGDRAVPTFVPRAAAAVSSQPPQPETAPFQKPSYSAAQLREFMDRQNTAQLLGIAEAYMGKPLTPAEMKSILYFSDELHFSDDLIDYLMQYCVDRGHKSFHYIEKTALEWAKADIATPKQAQEYTSLYNKTVYTIMKELGKSSSPAPAEVDYIVRWVNEYGFPMDVILEACRRTVLSVDKNRFEFAEKILKSWKEQNVRQKSDIVRLDDMFRQRRKPAAAASKQSSNRFNQFPQNDYDFEALEKALLSN